MLIDSVMDIMQPAIWTVIIVSAPPLLLGLTVGLAVSLFQTVTSIQEATLTFIPKILAVFIGLMIFGNFMLTTLTDFMTRLYSNLNYFLH